MLKLLFSIVISSFFPSCYQSLFIVQKYRWELIVPTPEEFTIKWYQKLYLIQISSVVFSGSQIFIFLAIIIRFLEREKWGLLGGMVD